MTASPHAYQLFPRDEQVDDDISVIRTVRLRAPAPPKTRVVVDLAAVAANMREVTRHVGSETGTLAVLKADAYGHGLIPVARTLEEQTDVSGLLVTQVRDGLTLREQHITLPIILLTPSFGEQHEAILDAALTPVLTSLADVAPFARAARHFGPVDVHVKIDTGMARLGLREEDVDDFLDAIAPEISLRIVGLCTHLSSADADDGVATARQLAAFEQIRRRFEADGHQLSVVHASNTAATFRHPGSHFTHVRTGIALFGGDEPSGVRLQPALRVVTEVAQLRSIVTGDPVSYGETWHARRPSVIATLPFGYASGYPRRLTGRGEVLVRGQRCPVVGNVCMEMMMVDVTDVGGVALGDEVVLLGAQGEDAITADEIALRTGGIVEELFCGLSQKLSREYLPPRSSP